VTKLKAQHNTVKVPPKAWKQGMNGFPQIATSLPQHKGHEKTAAKQTSEPKSTGEKQNHETN
jgi:hypothetical protein